MQILPEDTPQITCEQALRGALAAPGRGGGGREEGELATRSLEFEWILIWVSALEKSMRNADWRRWRHYPWHVFLNVCLHLPSFPLRADWRKSDSSVDREAKRNWRRNSNSRHVSAGSPSFSCPGELASPQTLGGKWMRDERTPKDVSGEATGPGLPESLLEGWIMCRPRTQGRPCKISREDF